MNCTECSRWLNDYVDGDLPAGQLGSLEAHLAGCANCRHEIDSLRRLRAMTENLPREIDPPRDLWADLKGELARSTSHVVDFPASSTFSRSSPLSNRGPHDSSLLRWAAPLAMAASVALLAPIAESMIGMRSSTGWSVAALAGTPRVGARNVDDTTRMGLGQWLETDDASRAKVTVGAIGEVSVEPNSRLRVVGMAATDHRLELARGTLSAMIYAPPRLFFVNTPSATAVDLGCAYTLKVGDDGNGELHVSLGFVSLEDRGRESIIRSGMMCLTRRGVGPGTPFSVDAPAPLRAAITRLDFEPGAADTALRDVLTLARPEDAITLWHLLDRTHGASLVAVFDRLAKFSPPPAGVTRAGILAGDAAMRKAWGTDLGIDRF